MFPQFIFLSNPSSQYQQTIDNFIKSNRYELHMKEHHQKQLDLFSINQKYVDSPLTKYSLEKIQLLKTQILKTGQFDIIVVAPLRKCIQTCYQLFKDQLKSNEQNRIKKNYFYLQPLLGDNLNSTQSIGNILEQMKEQRIAQLKEMFENFQILQKSQWIYDILPDRIKDQIPNTIKLTSCQQYLRLQKRNIKNGEINLETKVQYCKRLEKAKQKLLDYNKMGGSNKKVLVIGSREILSILGCTDFQEDGEPVNQLSLLPGEVQEVNLVVNGQNTIKQLDFQSILPFCR